MGVFDSVLSEMANRFGMSSSSAGSILSGLLSFITHQDGGANGFIERFKRAGLGSLVIPGPGGDLKPLSTDNVERAMGSDAVKNIGSGAGVSYATAASAIAFLVPKVIARIAPAGVALSSMPSEIMSYLTAPAAAFNTGVQRVQHTVEPVTRQRDSSRLIWAVLGLLLLFLGGRWLWTRASMQSFNVEEQVHMATQKAVASLDSLKPGFTPRDLVGALNEGVVNFSTGSTQIPPEDYEFLNKAATAIKSAPPGTVIQIAGHTDNSGDPNSNLLLSRQRAEAVRSYLLNQNVDSAELVATGFGEEKPVATNATEEGKFQNRRIEFTVADNTR